MKNKILLYNIQLSKQAITNATKVLESGWLSPGKMTSEFEDKILSLTDAPYGVAVSSATDGLQLVLIALGVGYGDEVITTPFTFVATIEAIIAVGATPVFADIDENLNIDPEDVNRKIGSNTKAIIAVDIAGYPSDYDALNEICTEHKLPIIADSAHAIGSKYKEKSIVHHVDASVISLHATKNLICGEGGIVLTQHKMIADAIRILSRHGMTSQASERKENNSWEYDIATTGIKGNMSELHAAVGLGQMTVFEKEQEKRNEIVKQYIENLSTVSEYISLPKDPQNSTHGWHLFIIKLNLDTLTIERDAFIKEMAKLGVECGVHYKPIFEFTYYQASFEMNPEEYPQTLQAWNRVVTLPLYPTLTLKDVDYICNQIITIIKKNR